MMGRWLKPLRGGLLPALLLLFALRAQAEMRAFKVPPQVLHMYAKGDVPDPFPWSIVGPVPWPDGSFLNPEGDASGDGWPTFTINGVTYEAECTFTDNDNGEHELAYSETIAGIWQEIVHLTNTQGIQEEDPAITTSPGGATRITYWRNNGVAEVWMTERASQTAPWSVPRKISTTTDPALHPSIASAFGKVHVGYEIDRGNGTKDIVVAGRLESQPNAPFTPEIVAHIGYSGEADVQVESAQGKLWVSWMQSPTSVGWTQWNNGVWAQPQFLPYSDPDSLEAARNQIRRTVEAN